MFRSMFLLTITHRYVMSPPGLGLVFQVDVVDRNGSVFPVSLWMKMLCTKPHPRCIAVLEPVERSSALLGLDKEVCTFSSGAFSQPSPVFVLSSQIPTG